MGKKYGPCTPCSQLEVLENWQFNMSVVLKEQNDKKSFNL